MVLVFVWWLFFLRLVWRLPCRRAVCLYFIHCDFPRLIDFLSATAGCILRQMYFEKTQFPNNLNVERLEFHTNSKMLLKR